MKKSLSLLCASMLLACSSLRTVRDARTLNIDATALAEKGEHAAAIALWREAALSVHGPSDAYILRNLGYALTLSGQPEAALAVLERACLLEPLNPRGWQHLANTLSKLGQQERASAMLRQAASLQAHDMRADYAATGPAGAPAVAQAVAAAQPASGLAEWASTSLPDLPAPVEDGPVLLEVRNGNGVRGFAAGYAKALRGEDWRVVRLSNQKGYGVAATRIEYQPDFRIAANRLAARIGDAIELVEAQNKTPADLRLVLGKDLARTRHLRGSVRLKESVTPS